MSVIALKRDNAPKAFASRQARFDRVAITSVFGDPLAPRTWSGAPCNLATALERLGVSVEGIGPRIGKMEKLRYAVRHVVGGYGRLSSTEQLLRCAPARHRLAAQVAEAAARLGVGHVIHTGTMDLPALDVGTNVKHYLYCDHTWALSYRFRTDAHCYRTRALREFERLERESLAGVEHVFTFGRYVRDNIIEHYGVPADRVTAVGSGMGKVKPYFGTKDFSRPSLLFVAKHLFREKGGELLVEAFMKARQRRPDLELTIVGDERSHRFVPAHPNIHLKSHLPWEELRALYQRASLLTQPMLNDPWGQVYLEALASRTPVLGLNRNGLPEIVDNGRYGFLVDRADPDFLADSIVDAVGDVKRLAEMGKQGQRHVLATYSWDAVAEGVLYGHPRAQT